MTTGLRTARSTATKGAIVEQFRHKGRNSRAVSPTLTPQGAREGSPNRHQQPKEDTNAAVLMNINENMGQMASLLTNLGPPDRKRRSSQTSTRLETRHTVESDSDESAAPDEDDRSHKRRRAQEHAQIDVHASDDDSVSADINLLTEPQSQQVTDQKNEDNSVLKELSDLLDEDETTGPAIQKQLAEIADKRWGAKLTPEKIKTLTERYNTPENITSMIPTKVNNEIWSLLSSAKKKMDLQ